jgi:hypothetical protein
MSSVLITPTVSPANSLLASASMSTHSVRPFLRLEHGKVRFWPMVNNQTSTRTSKWKIPLQSLADLAPYKTQRSRNRRYLGRARLGSAWADPQQSSTMLQLHLLPCHDHCIRLRRTSEMPMPRV